MKAIQWRVMTFVGGCMLLASACTVAGNETRETNAFAKFYEGEGGTQTLLCSVPIPLPSTTNPEANQITVYFKDNPYGCKNDEADSVVLEGFTAGSEILVTDDEKGDDRKDDSSVITVVKTAQKIVVYSFENENETDDGKYDLKYNHVNGLNGKVSFARITLKPEM